MQSVGFTCTAFLQLLSLNPSSIYAIPHLNDGTFPPSRARMNGGTSRDLHDTFSVDASGTCSHKRHDDTHQNEQYVSIFRLMLVVAATGQVTCVFV